MSQHFSFSGSSLRKFWIQVSQFYAIVSFGWASEWQRLLNSVELRFTSSRNSSYFVTRVVVLPCGHGLPQPEVENLLNSGVVGIPICGSCQEPIHFFPRFRTELAVLKSKVVDVFDKFFALKANLAATKKCLVQEMEGKPVGLFKSSQIITGL